jgi:hypothetical protein
MFKALLNLFKADEKLGKDIYRDPELQDLFPVVATSDRSYAAVSQIFMREHSKQYLHTLKWLKCSYTKNFDCDDFARGFAWYAQARYSGFVNRPAQAVAVGTVSFRDGAFDVPHMINVGVLDGGRVLYWEPQTGKEKSMSEKELQSIWDVRF